MGDNMELDEPLHPNSEADDDDSGAPQATGSSQRSARRSNASGTRASKKREPPAKGWVKKYYPEKVINQMIANPNTKVVFVPKPTIQGLLKTLMRHKSIDGAPRTKQAAVAYLATQSDSFKTEFGHYKANMEGWRDNKEATIQYHAWTKADRKGAARARNELRREAKERGEKWVKVPHPAGENQKRRKVEDEDEDEE